MGRKAGDKPKNDKKKARKPNKEGAHDKSQSGAYSGSYEEEEHSGGTGGRASKSVSVASNRDSLQEDVMTQVLNDYRAKPDVERKALEKPARVWPLFGFRRMLGLAHVNLHDAVLDGNMETIKSTLGRYIRKSPAKINEHDEEGRTALSLALKEQREDIADLILSIDQTDVNNPETVTGLQPLHTAVLLDLASSAQKLVFKGADVNGTDKVGMTPLMLGCRLGHESMVRMLVEVFGAELDPEDRAGWTCLFYATCHNEVSIVQYLLVRGANLDHKDKRGLKAIDWGEHMGFGETCAQFTNFKPMLAP